MTKPRMTQKVKWDPTKQQGDYFAFRDEIRLKFMRTLRFTPSNNMRITFYLPMPKSWPQTRRVQMNGRPHQLTPDKDNLEKGFLDAVFNSNDKETNDCTVWHTDCYKYWTDRNRGWIEVEHL